MSYMDEIAKQHYAFLPAGWSTSRVKFVANIQTSNVDKVASPDEIPVRLCNYTDVYYRDRITADLQLMEGTATRTEIEKFKLRVGQVLITKDSESWDDIGIPALVAEDIPDAVCGYHLAIFTPQTGSLDGAYLAWLCRADSLNDQFKLSANGVTRFGLGQYAMKNAVIAVPPLRTQGRIAAFLDEKTAQIDALIGNKQQLLERLAEKRQAIITQAVTKGLNPSAPMKDSAIGWLGQIPAHWDVVPLRRMVLLQRGHDLPTQDREDGDVLLVSSAGVIGQHSQKICDGPGIVTGRYGTVGDFYFVSEPYWPLNTTLYSREITCLPEFGFRLLQTMSHLFVLNSLKSAVPGIDRNDVLSEHVPRPPLQEQVEITEHIASGLDQATRNSDLVARSLVYLIEYRSALITSAVTGQIEGLR